jgi:hypothetical protein
VAAVLGSVPPHVVLPTTLYNNKIRRAVFDRILNDAMSTERVIALMRLYFSGIVEGSYQLADRLAVGQDRDWAAGYIPEFSPLIDPQMTVDRRQ